MTVWVGRLSYFQLQNYRHTEIYVMIACCSWFFNHLLYVVCKKISCWSKFSMILFVLCSYMRRMLDTYVESDYVIVYFHHGLTSDNRPSFKWLRMVYSDLERKSVCVINHIQIDIVFYMCAM